MGDLNICTSSPSSKGYYSMDMWENHDNSDNCDVAQLETSEHSLNNPEFGILFDVDGVLARGSTALDPAVKAINMLKDSDGRLQVPIAFVTNACNRSHDKASQISRWFNAEVNPDQVIHAPTPCKLLRKFHDQFVLVIGQEYRLEIAEDLGFNNLCTIEDIQEAYPLLDMVDHNNRNAIATRGYKENPNFPRVEAILLIGEPVKWESHLQLLMDLLLTEGKPTKAPTDPHKVTPLPIIACNMDLQFMAEACMPRFGHGAFLVCLEALYQKITGKPLPYTALVGKPCEITYRFAEHTVAKIAKRMGISHPIRRLYFFGDNPHVDIMGANLYDRFIRQQSDKSSGSDNGNLVDNVLPSSRIIPESEDLHEQTVEQCQSLLVETGVYRPEKDSLLDENSVYHGHRDILHEPLLSIPSKQVKDVLCGVQYIFEKEGVRQNVVKS